MQAQTEALRSAFAIMTKAQEVPAQRDMRALLTQMQTELNRVDRHVHELETSEARTLALADAIIPDILPAQYLKSHLQPMQKHILEILYSARGKAVRNSSIYASIYCGRSDPPESRIIHVQVSHIRAALRENRAALKRAGLPSYICIVWGQGWVLSHEPDEHYGRWHRARGQRA